MYNVVYNILYQFCWENGGYLAEFFSSGEERRVEDIVAKDLDYWIGLSDAASEGQFFLYYVLIIL